MIRLYELITGCAVAVEDREEESYDLGELWVDAKVIGDRVKVPELCEGAEIVFNNLYDRERNPLGYDVNTEHLLKDSGSYLLWPMGLIKHINSYYCEDVMSFIIHDPERDVVTLRPVDLLMMLKNEENEDVYVDSWLWPSVFMEPRGYKTCHTCTNCPGIQILLAAKEDDRIARNVDVEIKVRVVAGSTFYAFPIRYVFGLSGLLRRQRRPNRHINNSPRCAVCLEETAAVANIPCGHIATCQACAESLRDERCCICREQVTSTLQIYF